MVGRRGRRAARQTTLTAIWQRVRAELQASLPAATFELWLEPLRAVAVAAPRPST